MTKNILDELKQRPHIHLSARKLLYGCNLEVASHIEKGLLNFKADGTARFGPKRSPVSFGSTYSISNEINLKKAWFQLSGLKRQELYEVNNLNINSSINGDSSKISVDLGTKVYDILLLLHLFARNSTLTESAVIPIGNKLRKISLTVEGSIGYLAVGNKINLQFHNGEIKFPQFKANIDCKLF